MSRLTCITITFLMVVFLSIIAYPQQTWHWQNPLPQGNNLNDIQAINSNIGYAAGNRGSILKTISAGTHWELLEFPRLLDFSEIQFLNESIGWVVGKHGSQVYLYKTPDGGMSWEEKIEKTGEYISVSFLDESRGWVSVDSIIYYTEDNGMTWEMKNISYKLFQISFINSDKGWAIGRGRIYRTTDGGGSWQYTYVGEDVPYYFSLYRICMINEKLGWAAGNGGGRGNFHGYLFKTSDGGISWNEQLQTGLVSSDIEFKNDKLGWFVSKGYVYRTTDGGSSWDQVCHEISGLRYITSVTASHLWGVGWYGIHYSSQDSGATWTVQSEGVIATLEDMIFLGQNVGYACGERILLHTTNRGEVWEELPIASIWQTISAIWFTDSLHGVIGCTHRRGSGGIYRTVDGGYTWTKRIDNNHRIYDFYFLNDNIGWAVGGGSVIYHTTNGGNYWKPLSKLSEGTDLRCLRFTSAATGWAGGYLGLQKTTDGGYNWAPVDIPIDKAVAGICFINAELGWVVCDPYILRTANGGETWEIQTPHSMSRPKDIDFLSPHHGWVAGKSLLYTSNGGKEWEEIEIPTNRTLYRVQFMDAHNGWIMGSDGAILYTSDGINPTKGDVDGDGNTNALDVIKAVTHIIGLQILEDEKFRRADCNADGKINVLDVVGIVSAILGRGTCGP